MKYALERYNQLVNFRSSRFFTEDGNLDPDKFSQLVEMSRQEKENIQLYLRRKSFSIKSSKELELFIQQYQAEIIQLLDLVFAEKAKNLSEPHERLFDAVLQDLEDILTHIEHRYTKYFDMDGKAPATYLLITQIDLRKTIRNLKKLCSSILDKNLVTVVFTPLAEFVSIEGNVTFRQLMYMKDLVWELQEWSKGAELNQRNFLEVLIYMNFNVISLTTFIIEQIVNAINPIAEKNQKIERLADYLKQCNQAYCKPGVSFRNNLSSLKEQVASWILEEMHYLETKQRLLSVVPKMDEGIGDEERLHFSTSVDVLSLIARSAMDSKLVTNKELTSMFKSIARFVRTTNAEKPSSYSMLKKSYQAERSAKESAIDVLREMIKHLHKY